MDWQPIDTAPRDGTWVLLYEPGNVEFDGYFPVCSVAKWIKFESCGKPMEAWYVSQENDHEFTTIVNNPSHWVPLPEAPK